MEEQGSFPAVSSRSDATLRVSEATGTRVTSILDFSINGRGAASNDWRIGGLADWWVIMKETGLNGVCCLQTIATLDSHPVQEQ